MTTRINGNLSNYPAVQRFLKRHCPGNRKRTFTVCITDSFTQHVSDSEWSGGSKSYFSFIGSPSFENEEPGFVSWGGKRVYNKRYTLENDQFVIETGMFCGKSTAPRIHCNAATAKAHLSLETQIEE